MANDAVVRTDSVSKKFCRSLKHVMFYGAKDIARNIAGLSSRSEELREGEFWAVDKVSFELHRGETLGLIGSNGSGKSTLLKMINGIFMPDVGRIEIKGRIGALIEVGAGFHPMLSGRENVYINGAILGMSRKEIDKKFDEIVAFADIGDFIDAPVKHYSSGMHVRLGFAIAAHCDVDILLVDEVLAVGDLKFVLKCYSKLAELRKKGITSIIVSHNINYIKNVCSRALWLNKGKFVEYNSTIGVCDRYEREQTCQGTIIQFKEERVLQQVDVEAGDYIKFNLKLNEKYKDRDGWILVVGIKNSFGHILVNESLFGFFKNGNRSFSFYNQLRPGFYQLTMSICHGSVDNVIEWNEDFLKFEIPGSAGYSKGLLIPRVLLNT